MSEEESQKTTFKLYLSTLHLPSHVISSIDSENAIVNGELVLNSTDLTVHYHGGRSCKLALMSDVEEAVAKRTVDEIKFNEIPDSEELKLDARFLAFSQIMAPDGFVPFETAVLLSCRELHPSIQHELNYAHRLLFLHSHGVRGCSPDLITPRMVVDTAELLVAAMGYFKLAHKDDADPMAFVAPFVYAVDYGVHCFLTWAVKGIKDYPLTFRCHFKELGAKFFMACPQGLFKGPLSSKHVSTVRLDGTEELNMEYCGCSEEDLANSTIWIVITP